MNVANTANAYQAMRALLRAAARFNQRHPGAIRTIAIPGLCTGTRGMDPDTAARQMRAAYDSWLDEA